MPRIIYTYEQALIATKTDEPIYIAEDHEYYRVNSNDVEMSHPHDNFYSEKLTYDQELDAINSNLNLTH